MAEQTTLNDRYRLIEQIGSGGMAVLYKAQDLELGRLVAIKLLRPSLVSDPEFLIRFRREAQSAANLTHPNIVTVHDVGQDGPKAHYIVMEFVPGQDLKQLLRARGSFDVTTALQIIVEVCKGVGYAHRSGLVHCDIKPQNILVTPESNIKVADFGIARALTAGHTDQDDLVWGSPHYFSPEQAAGEPPTPASDVYSIGVVLFELLTGRLPFTGQDYRELALAHLKEQPPSILEINSSLPAEIDKLIRKVMAKEPAARYRTADQMGRIIENFLKSGEQMTVPFTVQPSQMPQDAAPPTRFHEEMPQMQPVGSPTIPALPQINLGSLFGRRAPLSRSVDENYEPTMIEDDLVPGIDFYGIVLGVLATAAVLGLIPLWATIWLTMTR